MKYWIVESPVGPMFHAVPLLMAQRSKDIGRGPKDGVEVEKKEFLDRLWAAVGHADPLSGDLQRRLDQALDWEVKYRVKAARVEAILGQLDFADAVLVRRALDGGVEEELR